MGAAPDEFTQMLAKILPGMSGGGGPFDMSAFSFPLPADLPTSLEEADGLADEQDEEEHDKADDVDQKEEREGASASAGAASLASVPDLSDHTVGF